MFVLSFREKILEYRSESQRLDQCSRLYDSSVSSEGFEFDASRIVQVCGLLLPSIALQLFQVCIKSFGFV